MLFPKQLSKSATWQTHAPETFLSSLLALKVSLGIAHITRIFAGLDTCFASSNGSRDLLDAGISVNYCAFSAVVQYYRIHTVLPLAYRGEGAVPGNAPPFPLIHTCCLVDLVTGVIQICRDVQVLQMLFPPGFVLIAKRLLGYCNPDFVFHLTRQNHLWLFWQLASFQRTTQEQRHCCIKWPHSSVQTQAGWQVKFFGCLWQGHFKFLLPLSVCITELALFKCSTLFLACVIQRAQPFTQRKLQHAYATASYFHGMGIAAEGD